MKMLLMRRKSFVFTQVKDIVATDFFALRAFDLILLIWVKYNDSCNHFHFQGFVRSVWDPKAW